MNKKVLSAILFGALMAGTGTFTSCIDNEEPASITTLRGAKAELLRAKAAVENAKVAQVQAEAEVARAQAALLQAQAAAVEAKAQADKALADAQLAEAQARAEIALAQAEKARLEAEAAYQKSILDLKKAQAELVATQQKTIAPIVEKYEAMLKIYFEAIDDQTEAERALAKHISVMEEKEASKALLTRELSREVTIAEKEYAGEAAALALAQEVLADAEALEPHELAEKAAELEAKKNEIDLAVADLKLEAAKALLAFYEAGRHQEVSDLFQEVLDLKNEEHTIPEFEFDFGDGAGLPVYAVRGKYTLEEGVFTYNDLDEYNARKDHYEDLLERLNSWVRDENDNAWTEERILELEAELEDAPEKLKAAKKAWAEAVAAYNTGKYNEADPTKISGYEDVVASITAFNTAVTAYNTARGAQAAADTKAADQTTMQNAKNQAWSVYAQEVEAADKARKEALGKLPTTIAETKKALEKAVTDAGKAVTSTKATYDKLFNESTDAIEIRAAYNTWKAAIKAEEEAIAKNAAYDGKAAEAQETEKINNTYTEAEAAAKLKAWNAEQAAVKAYNDKWDAKTGTSQLALNAAIEETVAKRTAAEEAKADLIEAAIAYNEAAEQTAIYGSDIDAAFEGTPDATKGYHVKQTLDVTTLLSLNKESLKQVVIDRSNYLYGTSIYGSNAYGDPEARLIEITEEEIKAAIEVKLEELGLYTYSDYINVLKNYGLIGETMAISEKLRIAKASLTNGEMIEAKIAEVEEVLEALEAHYAEVEAAIEEKQEEFETADAKLKEDIDALQEPINAKLAEKYPLQKLIDAYANAIIDYKNAGETVLTQADIDYYVSICKTAVETAEDNVYKAETEMLWAREILAKWNRGDIERKEILEIKLENANAEVERATTGLNEIRAQLEAAIEALQWTAAE